MWKKTKDNWEKYKLTRPEIIFLSEYEASNKKIKLECKKCKNKWETTSTILKNNRNGKKTGCPKCNGAGKGVTKKRTHIELLNILNEKNINELNYIGLYDDIPAREKFDIICLICDNKFQSDFNTLSSQNTGCPKCKNQSKGERMVEKVLKSNKIKYKTQYKVKELGRQTFDFYLPDYDIYIEYDGKQHFTPNTLFGSEEIFKKQQENDKKKDKYCKEKLLRIKYTVNNINKIKDIIMEKINEN